MREKAVCRESITVGSVAVSCGASYISSVGVKPTMVQISVQSTAIRFAKDGSVPTTTSGDIADAGDYIEVRGISDIQNLKFIRSTANNAIIEVEYHYPY